MLSSPSTGGVTSARRSLAATAVVVAAIGLLAAGATWWVQLQGYTLYSGDAQAHLNIARRVLDNRTPGVWQVGTVWLPLPHLLMMPLAGDQDLWANGLAGAIPVSLCFWVGASFFYLALRRLFRSQWAAIAGASAVVLNPNLLYLQATPMTEAIFVMALAGVLYGSVRFAESPGAGWSLFTALFALAGSITRYDGWFVLPFVAAFLLWKGGRRRWLWTLLFCVVAGIGPIWWFAHNWWFWGDALEFYRGSYSAKAIYRRQIAAGMSPYPGDGNLVETGRYYLATVRLVAGWPLLVLGSVGFACVMWKGPRWAAALLALPVAFYVASMFNGGTPIFVPELWPHALYNTRYGLVALLPLGFGLAALVRLSPPLFRPWVLMALLATVSVPWMFAQGPESWICWRESQANSNDRRVWLGEAATFMKRMYRSGDGILLSFGDLSGVLQVAGIPLKESLHEGNHPAFRAAVNRPDLFLRETWALCHAGDDVSDAMLRARNSGLPMRIVREFRVGRSAPVQIWRLGSEFDKVGAEPPRVLPIPLREPKVPAVVDDSQPVDAGVEQPAEPQ